MDKAWKHDVRTVEGMDSARELIRLASTGDDQVLQQVGADAPAVIEQLLDELDTARARYNGEFGARVAEAARECILEEDASTGKVRFRENVTVRSCTVSLVKDQGVTVVDLRLEVAP